MANPTTHARCHAFDWSTVALAVTCCETEWMMALNRAAILDARSGALEMVFSLHEDQHLETLLQALDEVRLSLQP